MSSYDITFCSNTNCKEYGCHRNQFGIPKEIRLVSISDFKECEFWEDKNDTK